MYKRNIINNEDRNLLNGLNIVILGGGSAPREVTCNLINLGAKVTRIVSSTDDGGNSGMLRNAFGIIPVGDIRNALTSMAEASNCPKSIVKLLNWRFSPHLTNEEILKELGEIISNNHDLTNEISPKKQALLSGYLIQFVENFLNIKNNKYLLNNSIVGNLVLVGAYFQNYKDINSSIINIKDLCSIKGSVWPAILDGFVSLEAILEDDSILIGENNITNLNRNNDKRLIKKIFLKFRANDEAKSIKARVNPEAIESIRRADIIMYGPGSFFTSVLPHMLITELVEAIAYIDVPKIFIGNILEDNETYNISLEQILFIFLNSALENSNFAGNHIDFVTHIMANKPSHGANPLSENRRYLQTGRLTSTCNLGIKIIINNYEKLDEIGSHNSTLIASDLLNIIKMP